MPFHISCICSSLSSITLSCETLSILLTSKEISTQFKLISPLALCQPHELVTTAEKFKTIFVTTHFRWAINAIRPSKCISQVYSSSSSPERLWNIFSTFLKPLKPLLPSSLPWMTCFLTEKVKQLEENFHSLQRPHFLTYKYLHSHSLLSCVLPKIN